ncbi:MAG TPA: uracil-DNA glycosylase, partial [Opitutaceae bacterium]
MSLKEHLLAVAEELQRLKGEGIASVAVDETTLESLRAIAGPAKREAPQPVVTHAVVAKPVRDVPVLAPMPAPPPRPREPAPPPPAEVNLPAGTKREQFDWLVAQVMGNPGCIRHVRPGKKVVVGVGNLDAKIMFVGEAPGAEEEIQGEPFVGPAGQLLNKMIKAMGIERGDVYIGNIMNWRPEMEMAHGSEQVGNRPPTAGEMAFCLPYLRAQIAIVKPTVLVALGGTAAKGLLDADAVPTIGAVKGRWHDFGGTPLMITYHPSYLLRN